MTIEFDSSAGTGQLTRATQGRLGSLDELIIATIPWVVVIDAALMDACLLCGKATILGLLVFLLLLHVVRAIVRCLS